MADKLQIDRLHVNGLFRSRKWLFDDYPQQGQELLQRARQGGQPVVCLCRGDANPIDMSVVLRDSRYHLRRLPKQGHAHHIDCVSYGGINEHAQRLYTEEALREEGDKIHITLNAPMSEIKKEEFRLEAGNADGHATERRRKSAMSVLGLLNYLWEEAQLNVWWPNMAGRRNASVVRYRLLEAAQDRMLGQNVPLPSVLFIPRPTAPGEASNNAGDLTAHLQRIRDMRGDREACFALVVGEINRLIEPSAKKAAAGIVLNQLFSTPLWDNHGLLAQLDRRFPHPMQRLRERCRAKEAHRQSGSTANLTPDQLPNDYLLYGIFAVGLTASGGFALKHGAVMETTRRFIPIASHYEGRVEQKLFTEGRAYEKPLVYDGERSYFPDFYLLDTGLPQRPVLEVYGYSGDEYEDRKRAKHVEYVRNHIPYWYWDLKSSPNAIPSFDAFPKAGRVSRSRS